MRCLFPSRPHLRDGRELRKTGEVKMGETKNEVVTSAVENPFQNTNIFTKT